VEETLAMTGMLLPVSKGRDLSSIITRVQNRNVNSMAWRPTVGVDTETDDGDIFLLADSLGNKVEYPNVTFDSVAKFLLRHEGKWLFFHNLSYDADCILRLLPESVLQTYRKSRRMDFEFGDYRVTYVDKKQLTIRQGKHSVSCYDIAQYYDNKKLEVAYAENIGKPLPEEYLQMKESRAEFDIRFFLRHKKAVTKYCVIDCVLAERLAGHWLDIFYRQFGFYPGRWVSAGYLAEKVIIHNGIDVPLFSDIPYTVQELAWRCFYGGRFELLMKGHIGACWLYDINSAYPYALTLLPDLTDGRWVSGAIVRADASAGYFHIRALVDHSVKVAPFPFRTKNNRIVFPVGEFETFVTLEELRMVAGDPKIRYEILESQQFIPAKNCSYPFRRFIEQQYALRLALKERKDPLERAIKVVLNSMYGKTAQRVNNVMGNLYNAAIASFITGHTRAQLYRFVKEHGLDRDVVAFATDSVAVRKEIPGLDSLRLGEMKLDNHAHDVVFLSNGFYRFRSKWKQRGVGYDREKKVEIEHRDTRVGDDGQLYILVETTRTTHIKSGIWYNRLGSVGKIEKYEKKIGLNSDRKRDWLDDLESLNDTKRCDSAPININRYADILADKSEIEWEYEQEEKYEQESDL
jgi:hypothetical protein